MPGEWVLHFDGLTEPVNPGGRMCWAWVLDRPGAGRTHGSGTIPPEPSNTNNSAEYLALGYGLRAVSELVNLQPGREDFAGLLVRGDSKLVVEQVNERWNINKPHLVRLHARCQELLKQIGPPWWCEWIPREQNTEADALSRIAYHEATGQWPPERTKGVVR